LVTKQIWDSFWKNIIRDKSLNKYNLKINIQNYQHFSFDLWLTLIKSNPEFKKKRDLLFKDFFELNCKIEKVSEVIRNFDVLCNNVNEKTGLNIDTFEIYYLILNALDIDIDQITPHKLNEFYQETELLFMKFKPNLIDTKIQLLFKEIVQQQKTISILSNTAFIKGITLKKLMAHYDLEQFLSFQIYSDETRFSKPNKAIFQLVYNQVKSLKTIEKKQILHIGDNIIADYNGAVAFGFESLLVKT
jgi:putative hydrolase of the HAD superfamily